jgi:hypothetical protein
MRNLTLLSILGISAILVNDAMKAANTCLFSEQKAIPITSINRILELMPEGWAYVEAEDPQFRLKTGTQFDANDPQLSVLGPHKKIIKKKIHCTYRIKFLPGNNHDNWAHTVGKFSIVAPYTVGKEQ